VRFFKEGRELIGENWLSCLPFSGLILDEGTTYGVVATNRLRAEDGSPVTVAPVFSEILAPETSSDPAIANAQATYAPLIQWLDDEGGDERADVVNASVFTTQYPTELMGRFRRVVYETTATPKAREVKWKTERRGYALYTGRYDSPNFQAGVFPYKTLAQGGGFKFDSAGDPIVQTTDDLRFSMTIPIGSEMPEAGWPIVLYAHGTTGDYLSYEQNGTAERMAAQGIAVISIDQLMHGDRLDQGDVQTLFFNFQNPLSSRANVMQAALEDYQLLRLVKGFDFVERHVGGRSVRFDASKVFFFGHSQGSVTGVPFAAREPDVKAAIFSGAGGLLYLTMLTKTEPYDITALLRLVIRDPEITKFHPALALLEAFYEPADAIVYAPLIATRPPEGFVPKSVFQPMGFGDSYTPRPTLEALPTPFGLDLVAPELEAIPGLELLQKRVLNAPVRNNVSNEAGEATVVGAQFLAAQGSDGHFVSFDIAAAKKQAAMFFKTYVDTGIATVVAP